MPGHFLGVSMSIDDLYERVTEAILRAEALEDQGPAAEMRRAYWTSASRSSRSSVWVATLPTGCGRHPEQSMQGNLNPYIVAMPPFCRRNGLFAEGACG